MSVLIRGMEMPKNCAYCPLSEYRNSSLGQILDCKQIGTVGTAFRDNNVLKRRHPNCPLVEIPTPHGRLIDADILKEVLERNFGHTGGASVLAQLIDARPTVIEAEGSEE